MIIYRLRADVGEHRMLALVHYSDQGIAAGFKGDSLLSTWQPYPIKSVGDGEAHDFPIPDFATLGAIPVFSGRAVTVLRSFLEHNGEILPFTSQEGDFFAFNATRVLNALDEERSEVRHYADGGVKDITRYEFVVEKLTDAQIFKIPQRRTYLFVTDPFVESVSAYNLSGFDFQAVWTQQE